MTQDPEKTSTKDIREAAADWFACMCEDAIMDTTRREFEVWRNADPRHALAYEQCCTLWMMSHELKQDQEIRSQLNYARTQQSDSSNDKYNALPLYRSHFQLKKISAIAAMALFAILLAVKLHAPQELNYYSQIGEQKNIRLKDGSLITLNTNSSIKVLFTSRKRQVELVKGEAYFDVAKNKEIPFLVRIDHSVVRAVGTEFNIAKLADTINVAVTEGVVEFTKTDREDSTRSNFVTKLKLGDAIRFTPGETDTKIEKANFAKIKAWRENKIYFNEDNLETAVNEYNRYIVSKIIIVDNTLKKEKITGIFQQGDIESFLFTLERALNARVERYGDRILLMKN